MRSALLPVIARLRSCKSFLSSGTLRELYSAMVNLRFCSTGIDVELR
jgi:hypothetical protein